MEDDGMMMSSRAISQVLKYSRASRADKFILTVIAHHFNEIVGQAWPSISVLAKETGYDQRRVKRSLANLRRLGEIRSDENNGGRNRSNRYYITLPVDPLNGGTHDTLLHPNGGTGDTANGGTGSRLDLVFCNEFGEPCDRTGIGRYGLKPALEQAGIDKAVSMHGFRHTYASMLILLGRKIPQISRHLGHADVSITMRVYAHFLQPKKQDTMSDLERLIENG